MPRRPSRSTSPRASSAKAVYKPLPRPLGHADAAGRTVSALNDAMRKDPTRGEVLFDSTIAARSPAFKDAVLRALAAHDTWFPGSDPRGHHDFGLLTVGRDQILFQFQYRSARDRRLDADDPSDPTTTHRVVRLELYR